MVSYSLDKKQQKKSSYKCRLTLAILALFGALLLVGGSIVYVKFFPQALKEKIAEGLTISAGSEAEERFLKSPVPYFFKVFIFNVTNKDEVNDNGTIPVLQETGPYVFRLEKIREIEGWDQEQGTVFYHEVKSFTFLPEHTRGTLSDRVNHVNLISIGMGPMMQKQAPVFRALGMSVDEMISNIRGNMVETHTVGDLLFNGFLIKEYFPEDNEHLCRLKNNCSFSFWKNNTRSLLFEVKTGAKGIDDITRVVRYNNKSTLPFWYGDTCNSINGTVGPQFKPGMTKDESFYAFSPEICRSLEFEFVEPTEVLGISTLRYQARENSLSYKNGSNQCFCPEKSCEDKEGLMMLGSCHDGGPVAVSWPHFYLGTDEQIKNFKGLKPDKTKHSTIVDIEPLTGTAMGGYKRLQVNIIVKPDPRVQLLRHAKKIVYFPIIWIEESGSVDDVNADKFRAQVLTPYRLGKWSLLSAMAVGTVLLLLTLIAWTLKRH